MSRTAAWNSPKWQAFSAIGLTYITTVFATAFAFLALPDIAADFDVTLSTVGWVVIVESLLIASLLLPLGGLGDVLGSRRVLSIGIFVFGIGALLTGLSPTFIALIGARIVMALGNALIQSVATGLVFSLFPSNERGLAMGAQTSSVAVGSMAAPLLGGVGLEFLSWRTIFMLLVIPTALAFVAVRTRIPKQQTNQGTRDRRFDVLGSVLSALTITVLVVTISNPFSLRLTSPIILGGAVLAVALLALFVRWELATDHPLFELRLFAERGFRTSVALRTFGFLATAPATLLMPIYLLSFREVSAAAAGVVIALLSIGMGTAGQVAGRLYDAVGARTPSLVGFALQVLVSLIFAFSDESTSLILFGAASAAAGFGLALWNVPNNSAMLAATPPEYLGVSGAFSNLARTLGSVIGQAVATAVVAAVMASRGFDIPLDELTETIGAPAAFNDGWKTVFLLSAGFSAVLLLVASRLPSNSPR